MMRQQGREGWDPGFLNHWPLSTGPFISDHDLMQHTKIPTTNTDHVTTTMKTSTKITPYERERKVLR